MLPQKRVFSLGAYSITVLLLIVSTPSLLECKHVFAIPSAHSLDVPYHVQQTDYYCAPASVQMALEYLLADVIPQDLLAREMNTIPVKGTEISMVPIPFVNRRYASVKERRYAALDELKEMNSQGYVSTINIWFDTDQKSGHYVVLVGYNLTGVFVNDPWPADWSQPKSRKTGKNAFIPNSLLTILWTRHNQWVLEIPYHPRTVKQHVMCKEVDESASPWRPIGVTERFSTADDQAVSFLELENAIPPFNLQFVWLAPDGRSARLDPLKITWRSGSVYSWIKMEGTSRPVGIWTVEAYADGALLSKTKFTLAPALELVSKILTPKEGEPIFAGDTVTVTYELKNTGKTTLKAVNFTMGTPLPKDVSLLEATSPKDMTPRATEKFTIKIRLEKEGSYKLMIKAYVNDVLTEEAPLTVQVSPLPLWRNPAAIGAIVAFAIVASVAAFLLLRGKRGPLPPKPTTPTYAPTPPGPLGPATTKYCFNCGELIPFDAKHCTKCGAPQE